MVPGSLWEFNGKQFMKIGHEYFSNPPLKFYETSLFPIKGQT